MLKAIIAVVIGFIVWTALFLGSNALIKAVIPGAYHADGSVADAWILLLALALSFVFSVASGWTAGRLAGAWAFASGLGLGALLFVVGVGVQWQYRDSMPLWYHLAFLLALWPMAMLGARLARHRARLPHH
jgi:hypothetical protein